MKKIPDELDNPIDNVLIEISDRLSPLFKSLNHTPNMITTYSLITGLISCYFLNKRDVLLFSVFYTISYFFDCFDGHFARKYELTTKLGDFYDHSKDAFIFFLILYITIKNSRKRITFPIILIVILFSVLAAVHMSCQELNCNDQFKDKSNDFLLVPLFLCGNKDNIKWTRYFGVGTYNIFFISIISYINREIKDENKKE
jgi:phosphatidylglycerophosphate synthase